jgi:hypothetical protein
MSLKINLVITTQNHALTLELWGENQNSSNEGIKMACVYH